MDISADRYQASVPKSYCSQPPFSGLPPSNSFQIHREVIWQYSYLDNLHPPVDFKRRENDQWSEIRRTKKNQKFCQETAPIAVTGRFTSAVHPSFCVF
ncbi:hypothetical protein PoB_007372000 [Plakobranchus ocellatus]|uniref:Uncharacterized protein n=1 Tax=Plakobranchus ocellatus TaxID=259542 RepID=A0AAV4DSU0_9GAST|nr:hypothetical protein PoB_007372000 [Plakobranchus ocellatus]